MNNPDHNLGYDIGDKLVIGVSSSALFDIACSDRVFKEQGTEAYRAYQIEHENDYYSPGVAFGLVKRILSLNAIMPLIEVVLLSHNDCDTSLRVMNSIEYHGLNIVRAAFVGARSPADYLQSFNVKLFVSQNQADVTDAITHGYAAGYILNNNEQAIDDHDEFRIAFDFDGILASDEAEKIYQSQGLNTFVSHEQSKAEIPLQQGPLHPLLAGLARLQKEEQKQAEHNPDYKRKIRVAIVTARNAPAHKRMILTLRAWGLSVDETFLLGGINKAGVLKAFNPCLFIDDQASHLSKARGIYAALHVPFGVSNSAD